MERDRRIVSGNRGNISAHRGTIDEAGGRENRTDWKSRESTRSKMAGESSDDTDFDSQQKTERNYFVAGIEQPPFTTHQTKYFFSMSPPRDVIGPRDEGGERGGGEGSQSNPATPLRGQCSVEALKQSMSIDWGLQRKHGQQTAGGWCLLASLLFYVLPYYYGPLLLLLLLILSLLLRLLLLLLLPLLLYCYYYSCCHYCCNGIH